MPPRGGRGPAPSAASVLASARAQIAKGWPPGLTVLTGDDLFHLDAAQKALLAHLVPEQASDFALSLYSEGKVAVADVVAAARSLPMFALRRVVFVRDVGILEGEPAPLQAFAAAPPSQAFLVVRAPKLDLRRQLHQALAKEGRLLEFRAWTSPSEDEIVSAIAAIASEHGLVLEAAAAEFLFEACAGDLHRIAREIEKLDAWAGPGTTRKIAAADVRAVCAAGGLMDGWEAADAVLDRDPPRALEAVRRLLDGGQEPLLVLGGLAWRARTLLQAKAMLESGSGAEEVTQTLKAWGYRERLHAGLRKYSLAELLAFPARLRQADLALKSRGLDPRAILESLVFDLTRRAAPEGGRKGA